MVWFGIIALLKPTNQHSLVKGAGIGPFFFVVFPIDYSCKV